MRRFKSRPTRVVALSVGDQTISYTVTAPDLFFASRFRSRLPLPGDEASDEEQTHWMDARVVIYAAEGLRSTEADIPTPPETSDPAAWYDYADRLGEMFQDAGFNSAMVNVIFEAFVALSSTLPEPTEAIEQVGNG